MQILIIFLTCYYVDTLMLGSIATVAYVVNNTIPNLIKIFLDAVLFATTNALHDEVFFTIHQNYCKGPTLLIDFRLEIKCLLLEEIDFGVYLIIYEFVIVFKLDRLNVYQVDLFYVLHFACCQTNKITIRRRL